VWAASGARVRQMRRAAIGERGWMIMNVVLVRVSEGGLSG
jgi:hypothetical protein